MIKSIGRYTLIIMLPLATITSTAADQAEWRTLQAMPVSESPVIDGNADDPVWRNARPIVVRDAVADIPLTLSAVYTPKQVFFLVSFPDDAPDLAQKTFVWDSAAGRYRTGPAREDTFVFKWAINAGVADLTLGADQSYKADIWYWKACRTDPVGYADDKLQIYSRGRMPRSKLLLSRDGHSFYLHRSGDAGQAAYRVVSYPTYQADTMPKYTISKPTGSRADIRAKGAWRDGVWTLEFGRALLTGHPDDVQFSTWQYHLFGVSRYEIAGRQPNPTLQQPLFGSGEVSEHLQLSFVPAP